jgi:hypothetical protein
MNKEHVPIKYHLSMWKSLPGYPTGQDFLYEVLSYLEKNSKTGDFSEQTLNYAVGAAWKDTHSAVFADLVGSGAIEEDMKGEKKIYRIKDNPFL